MIVVALTGWGQEEDIRRSNEAGFNHHVVKPVDPAALFRDQPIKFPTTTMKDFPKCWHDLDLTVEVEAKAKVVAVLKLKTELEQQRKHKKVRNQA